LTTKAPYRTGEARDSGRALAVATIEDLFLVQPNRLAHAVAADVLDQLVELPTFEQREELRQSG
jgi:hypothetical protein